MAAWYLSLCGLVVLLVGMIVARDVYREIRACREWQPRLSQRGAAADGD